MRTSSKMRCKSYHNSTRLCRIPTNLGCSFLSLHERYLSKFFTLRLITYPNAVVPSVACNAATFTSPAIVGLKAIGLGHGQAADGHAYGHTKVTMHC